MQYTYITYIHSIAPTWHHQNSLLHCKICLNNIFIANLTKIASKLFHLLIQYSPQITAKYTSFDYRLHCVMEIRFFSKHSCSWSLRKNLTKKLRYCRLTKIWPTSLWCPVAMSFKCIIDRRKSRFDFHGITAHVIPWFSSNYSLCRRCNMPFLCFFPVSVAF